MGKEQVMINQYYVMWKGLKNPKEITLHWRGQPDPHKTISLPRNKWVRINENDAAEIKKRAGKENPNWDFMIKEVAPAEDRIDNLENKFGNASEDPGDVEDTPNFPPPDVQPLSEGDTSNDSLGEKPEKDNFDSPAPPKPKKRGRKKGSTKRKKEIIASKN